MAEIGEDHDPETHLIPLVLDAASGRRPDVTVFGTDYPAPDGTAVRDYVHVCDLAPRADLCTSMWPVPVRLWPATDPYQILHRLLPTRLAKSRGGQYVLGFSARRVGWIFHRDFHRTAICSWRWVVRRCLTSNHSISFGRPRGLER